MSDQTPRTSMRFQIEVIKDRELEETVFLKEKDEDTGKVKLVRRTQKRIVKGDSYHIYFPGGHSIWVESKADLARLHLTDSDNFEIDLETGLPVEPPKRIDLKERVQRATRSAR